jgi:predicted dehydrogenase
MKNSRRDFIKKTVAGSAGISFGGVLSGFSANSYGSIMGANDRVVVSIMGLNGRGRRVGPNFAVQQNCNVKYACDVDSQVAQRFLGEFDEVKKKHPKLQEDFRKTLEDKEVDTLVITSPDHWHAPATILACQAGKHVYVEKPCSHNPKEGEMMVEAAKRYNRVVQMGSQRRSLPNFRAGIEELHAGAIGRPYLAKTWYANDRKHIEKGQRAAVPSHLNYELWQGPAPRTPYMDNIIHYNWHWFWNWGTGEALNNGTHTVDLARWGLGVDFPVRVTSSGGRYDQPYWETPDTQIINLEFDNKSMITWEGRSSNELPVEGTSTGVMFYGDNGSLFMGERNAYKIFDTKGNVVKDVKNEVQVDDQRSLSSAGQQLDAFHITNFLEAIRKGSPLNQGIASGHKSTLLLQLGNIALRTGRTLNVNPDNGHINNDDKAMKYWSREYEPGWEPRIS